MIEYEKIFDFKGKKELAAQLLRNYNVRAVINILKNDENKLTDNDARSVCREVIEEVADKIREEFLADAYDGIAKK